ncbi:MAG: hypothetical protein WCO55_04820 [Candidatus Falkowbacteria bacterium]
MLKKTTTKTFVQFLFSAGKSTRSEVQEVFSRDYLNQQVPAGAFAFYYFDVDYYVILINNKFSDSTTIKLNHSALYYVGARVYSYFELKKMPEYLGLLKKMQFLGIKRAVRTRAGDMRYLHDDDIVLPSI